MINTSQAKSISKFLSSHLKDKGIKQSELLELLAQMENYKDWNTFFGVEKNQELAPEIWTDSYYINIDNGGYFFSYDILNKLLKVETSFFGYVATETKVKMTIKELEKMLYAFEQYWVGAIKTERGNGWKIKDGLTIVTKDSGHVLLTFSANQNINPIEILKKFLEDVKFKNQHWIKIINVVDLELNGWEIILQKLSAMNINEINRYFKRNNLVKIVYQGRNG